MVTLALIVKNIGPIILRLFFPSPRKCIVFECVRCAFDDSLDQVYPVVDGGPVEERHVLLVGLPDVEARLHQLPAALDDSVPGKQAADS